jgi:hypothetical protein
MMYCLKFLYQTKQNDNGIKYHDWDEATTAEHSNGR